MSKSKMQLRDRLGKQKREWGGVNPGVMDRRETRTRREKTDYLTCAGWHACEGGAVRLYGGRRSGAIKRLGLRQQFTGHRDAGWRPLVQTVVESKDSLWRGSAPASSVAYCS